MSYVLSNHGELLVAAQAADERSIQRALKQLDDRLVLAVNPDDDRPGGFVWQVVIRYGGDVPAHVWFSWRDEYGRPLPLSSMLVEEVKRLREVDTFKESRDHNRRLKERANADDLAEATGIAEDMLPRIHGKKLALLHRGVHLRRSRRRNEDRAAEEARTELDAFRRARHERRAG